MEVLRVRIVILNFNGAELLPQCLPSVVEAASKSSVKTSITVLDNLSQDQSLEYVRKHFPSVTVAIAKANKVLCSYNEYAAQVSEPILIFLNNDIKVDPDFVDPLVRRLIEDPQCFLAAPRVMSFDGKRVEAGKSRCEMRFGLYHCDARYPGYEKDVLSASETDTSGFGAFSREKFLALGGYDERYLPGIMEDVDLCYRAKQAGYHLYYEPQSVVYHLGQASFKKKFGSSGISTMAHRNTFLFMWKTFKDFKFWAAHLSLIPLRLLFSLLKGDVTLLKGFGQALKLQWCKQGIPR